MSDEEFVYKGPWEADNEKIKTLQFRTDAINMFHADCVAPEFVMEGNEIWLKFKNLATKPKSEWKMSLQKGKLETEPVLVVERESLGYQQLSKLSETEQYDILFGQQLYFKNYILMALLGVGDMGPWNTIVTGEHFLLLILRTTVQGNRLNWQRNFSVRRIVGL